MTIAVAGNFTEGVVFGAESATTYPVVIGGMQLVQQIYEGAQKIYHLGWEEDCSDSPYGALIFGAASFEGQSWRNVFANFWREVGSPSRWDCKAVVDALVTYLRNLQPDETRRNDGGLFLAGFGDKDRAVECYRISVKPLTTGPVPMGIVDYDGLPSTVERIMKGIDRQTADAIRKGFAGATIEKQNPDGSTQKKEIAEFIIDFFVQQYPPCAPDSTMPLRDAIDYVNFLVYSTVKYYKFGHIAKMCGGDTELAVITLDRGFRRVRRKPLDAFIAAPGHNERRGF